MKIYTKTGDKGETSLVGGRRVRKDDCLLDAYGTIDELNAWVGVVFAETNEAYLTDIQRHLFVVGGMMATEPADWTKYWSEVDLSSILQEVEAQIDRLSVDLESFKGFVLPQGSLAIAHIHVCRTVCRRAERMVVKLSSQNEAYDMLLKIVNRLSDFFFIFAQYWHKKNNIPVTYWK